MHRSPRMIPSRTVFNHCKWIYIELAITSAHSGMGPLCISSAPTPAARARANVFPISSLRAVLPYCSSPSTLGIVARSQPYAPPCFLFCSLFPLFRVLLFRCVPLTIFLSLSCTDFLTALFAFSAFIFPPRSFFSSY